MQVGNTQVQMYRQYGVPRDLAKLVVAERLRVDVRSLR